MKRKNYLIILFLSCMLFMKFTSLPVYAIHSYETKSGETNWKQLVYDYSKPITSSKPYITDTFVPNTNRIQISYGGSGGSNDADYNFYLEMLDSYGAWTIIRQESTKGTLTTSEHIIAGNTYRVRITTNNRYSARVYVNIKEYIGE